MSIRKKSILVFTDWYLPGYRAGGPIRSLANMVNTLKHDFYIVTRNTDHHSSEPYRNITPNEWIKTADNARVYYFDEASISADVIEKIIRDLNCDRIYFNSLFSRKFTLLPLRIVRKMKLVDRAILAPRGMLKAGALSVKAGKKRVFLLFAKVTGLYDGLTWHATSHDEKNEIMGHFPKALKIHIAPNLSSVPNDKPLKPHKQQGELKLVCIARISPEKGILEAIRFLVAAALNGNVTCDFYGTQQNASYLRECESVAGLSSHLRIQFKGDIPQHDIPVTIAKYHFFYLPTLGENHGHAIVEALTNATPVIISDRTPWHGLASKMAGWDLPLEAGPFTKVLTDALAMNNNEYQQWSDGAYKYGMQVALDYSTIEASHALFMAPNEE